MFKKRGLFLPSRIRYDIGVIVNFLKGGKAVHERPGRGSIQRNVDSKVLLNYLLN